MHINMCVACFYRNISRHPSAYNYYVLQYDDDEKTKLKLDGIRSSVWGVKLDLKGIISFYYKIN